MRHSYVRFAMNSVHIVPDPTLVELDTHYCAFCGYLYRPLFRLIHNVLTLALLHFHPYTFTIMFGRWPSAQRGRQQ